MLGHGFLIGIGFYDYCIGLMQPLPKENLLYLRGEIHILSNHINDIEVIGRRDSKDYASEMVTLLDFLLADGKVERHYLHLKRYILYISIFSIILNPVFV